MINPTARPVLHWAVCIFAHGLPDPGVEINLFRLQADPTRLPEQRVDVVASFLFRVLVFGHRTSLCIYAEDGVTANDKRTGVRVVKDRRAVSAID